MRRFTALLLAVLTLLSLTACGGQDASVPEEDTEDPGGEPVEVLPPEPEPYDILDPTVMPEGGVRDGVTYVAYDGIVEHLFFHPVIAYPELAFDGDAQEKGLDGYLVRGGEDQKGLHRRYDKG